MLDTELKIIKIIQETPEVKTFWLDLEGREFSFTAGQFLSLTIPTQSGVQIRSFSIASSPATKDHLDITVKRYEDSLAAKALHGMQVGQGLNVKAAFGMFTLRPEDRKVCMIAGGNGITPMMSMLRTLAAQGNRLKPTLIYSNRTEKDIIFYKELRQLEKDGFVDLKLTLTDEKPAGWNRLTGRPDIPMLQEVLGNLSDWAFYLCGPPVMVQEMEAALQNAGVPAEKIRKEQFIRPPKPANPA